MFRSIAVIFLCACGASMGTPPPPAGDAPPSACGALSGTWEMSGSCGDDECTITQSACAITQLTCDSGAHSTSGTITGSSFRYTGASGANIAATCDGAIAGTTISGTCNVAGATSCSFSGTRQ